VEKVIASHIGTNGETGRQYLAGELTVELVPQGTLAERIRCGGAGLGGVLTPVGMGTVVEEGKKKIISGTREYLLELPLRADVAFIQAIRADTYGNLIYDQTARNFNPLMALAADVVAVLADEVTPVGALLPDSVATPGIVVDYVVAGGKDNGC
jgi:acetate CoA/acetoacetate CoA-transferase alpha subunit